MTSDQRLWSAIHLEKPDRVPVIPTLLPEPAAGLTGRTGAQISSNNKTAVCAMMNAFDEYGGWDNPYPGGYTPLQLQAMAIFPMKMKIPGVDLPNDYMYQLVEEEVMKPEDYDRICEMGFESFYYEDFLWRITNLKPEELSRTMDDLVIGFGSFLEECANGASWRSVKDERRNRSSWDMRSTLSSCCHLCGPWCHSLRICTPIRSRWRES